MSSEEPIEHHLDGLAGGLFFPLTTGRRVATTVVVAALTFLVAVLSTYPTMTVQLLHSDVGYLDEAFVSLLANTYATAGAVGVTLVFAYATLSGVVVTNVVARARVRGVRSVGDLGSVAPGLLASGCASCGAGVLGLVGLAGAVATLPFHGNLLRLAGVVLLLGYLSRAGDPRRCSVP